MHLVDEQHRLRAVHAQRTPGGVDRGTHVLDAGADRGKLHESAPGHLADHVGERGLAGARRSPQQQRHRRVVVDQLAERRAGPVRCRWPITSSRVRGRIRTASGAAALAAVSSASSNRLSDRPSSLVWPFSVLISRRRPGYPQESTPVQVIHRLGAPAGGRPSLARHDEAMSTDPCSQRLEVQAAAIARRQGDEAGIDPETMRTRIRGGRWQRLQRGVYATFTANPAGRRYSGPPCSAPGRMRSSHQTAAERHGLIDEPSPLITHHRPGVKQPGAGEDSRCHHPPFGRDPADQAPGHAAAMHAGRGHGARPYPDRTDLR